MLIFLAKLLLLEFTNVIIYKTDDIVRKLLLTNFLWNILFLIIVYFDVLFLTNKLLIIYYLINNGITLFGCIKILIKINTHTNIFLTLIPNYRNSWIHYLAIISTLLIIDITNIIFNLKLDWILYFTMALVTLYYVKLHNLYLIYTLLKTLLKLNRYIVLYVIVYLVENIITVIVYYSLFY